MKASGILFAGMALSLAFVASFAGYEASAQSPLSENIVAPAATAPVTGYVGVGPVTSGSVDYPKLPSKARKFLENYCDGHALVVCDKEYETNSYRVELADGIEMRFDHKGRLMYISAPQNYSLSPYLLKAVVPGKLYNLLDHNGFRQSVEAVHHSDNKSFRLEIADPVFNEICFDKQGVLTLIAEK